MKLNALLNCAAVVVGFCATMSVANAQKKRRPLRQLEQFVMSFFATQIPFVSLFFQLALIRQALTPSEDSYQCQPKFRPTLYTYPDLPTADFQQL
jgi:hypothetical protein